MALEEKLQYAKLLITDIDGVLTDGRIWLDTDKTWKRAFNVRDGEGLLALQRSGIEVAMISAGDSEDVRIRAEHLKISEAHFNQKDKLICLQEIKKKKNLKKQECIYIGDDITDLKLIEEVGFFCTVPYAVQEVLDKADYVTKRPGGHGAVREVCDFILKFSKNSKR